MKVVGVIHGVLFHFIASAFVSTTPCRGFSPLVLNTIRSSRALIGPLVPFAKAARDENNGPDTWHSATDPFVAVRWYAREEVTDDEIRELLAKRSIRTMEDLKKAIDFDNAMAKMFENIDALMKSGNPKEAGSTPVDSGETSGPDTWTPETDAFIAQRYFSRDDVTDDELREFLARNSIRTLQDLKDFVNRAMKMPLF